MSVNKEFSPKTRLITGRMMRRTIRQVIAEHDGGDLPTSEPVDPKIVELFKAYLDSVVSQEVDEFTTDKVALPQRRPIDPSSPYHSAVIAAMFTEQVILGRLMDKVEEEHNESHGTIAEIFLDIAEGVEQAGSVIGVANELVASPRSMPINRKSLTYDFEVDLNRAAALLKEDPTGMKTIEDWAGKARAQMTVPQDQRQFHFRVVGDRPELFMLGAEAAMSTFQGVQAKLSEPKSPQQP
jgi:hypothetical protein